MSEYNFRTSMIKTLLCACSYCTADRQRGKLNLTDILYLFKVIASNTLQGKAKWMYN